MFTRRIGAGVVAALLKHGIAGDGHVAAPAESLLALNRLAREAMLDVEVHGCMDVTTASACWDMRRQGAVPGASNNNRESVAGCVRTADPPPPEIGQLLYGPRTPGGLLIALPEDDAATLAARLCGARRLGRVRARAKAPLDLL